MDGLASFFEINSVVIRFAYGLTFFAMGLMIALQSRQTSRLELARSLTWLAGFGLVHGLHEWGDVFIPIQAAYLDEKWIHLFYLLRLMLLSTSFACLTAFGVSLLAPFGIPRWLRLLPMIVFTLWVTISFFVFTLLFREYHAWVNACDALARYIIALPSAMLSTYGLIKYARLRVRLLNVPQAYFSMLALAAAMGMYSIFGGLLVPPVPFFPGSMLNAEMVKNVTGIPVIVFRSFLGLVMSVSTIRLLELFDVETRRKIESLEQDALLSAERERIGRELHDGAIQKVYTAGLLARAALNVLAPNSVAYQRIEQASSALDAAVSDLRASLQSLQSEESCIESVSNLLHQVASNAHYMAMVDIQLQMDISPDLTLPAAQSGHLLRIINEAMANALRHAQARHVCICATRQQNLLRIIIRDDGRGFLLERVSGNGLRNMQDRARLLNGNLQIQSSDGKGTTIQLDVPILELPV